MVLTIKKSRIDMITYYFDRYLKEHENEAMDKLIEICIANPEYAELGLKLSEFDPNVTKDKKELLLKLSKIV